MSGKEIWVLTEQYCYDPYEDVKDSFYYFLGKPSLSLIQQLTSCTIEGSIVLLEEGYFNIPNTDYYYYLENVPYQGGLEDE